MAKTVQTVNWEPDQQFQAKDGLLWELEKPAPVTTSIPHVRLIDPRDRTVLKIIATSVLLDRRRFTSIGSRRDP